MKTSRQVAPHPDTLRTAAAPRARRAARTPAATGAAYGDVVSTLVGGTALLLTMSVFLGLA